MANLFLASIYGLNANAQGTAQGRLMAFPSQGVIVRPVITDSTFNGVFNGVTMNSVIQILPSGGQAILAQPQWYSAQTVSALVTAANA